MQLDSPVEHDTFVLVRESSGRGSFKDKRAVLLAGRTQSDTLDVTDISVTCNAIAEWNVRHDKNERGLLGISVCMQLNTNLKTECLGHICPRFIK